MKKFFTFLLFTFFSFSWQLFAQSKGYQLDFNSNDYKVDYAHNDFTVSNEAGRLIIDASSVGTEWQNFQGSFPETDLTTHPVVYVKIKSSAPAKFEIRVRDSENRETNKENPKVNIVESTTFKWVRFNFTGKFNQEWPTADTLNYTQISAYSILINGGGAPDFTGRVEIDEIVFGDSASAPFEYDPVVYQPKINQLGYLTKAPKVSVIPSARQKVFYLVEKSTGDTVFSGTTSKPVAWTYSEETVVKADFSEFQRSGTYVLRVDGFDESYDFIISDTVYQSLLPASVKAFYFNRASIDLEGLFAGKWARTGGHFDKHVVVHSSAATPERPEGTVIESPKGWYDAGDYNKYVVPAGIAVWQVISSREHFQEITDPLSLNVPESSNSIPDILDEALWEIEWLRTMQDPVDGGVYHKLTTAEFEPMVMPENATATRYVVQKSTPATLNFAAVLAKASRVYNNYPEVGEEYDKNRLLQAEQAWAWAKSNPDVQFDQESLNENFEPDIITGDYGLQSYNVGWDDEWFWAAVELYLATGKQKYLDEINFLTGNQEVSKWSHVEYMGLISILKNKANFPKDYVQSAKDRVMDYASVLLSEYEQSAYGITLGASEWEFSWNSNAHAFNHSVILLLAYEITNNREYYDAASSNIDYVLGKNPLNYCFITGFGDKSPMNIHHRVSISDGVEAPVPGLLVNGPHNRDLSYCHYPTTIPAFTYLDKECSSATNEVGIYGYSAVVYALSCLQSHYKKPPVGVIKNKDEPFRIKLFPNPNNGNFKMSVPKELKGGFWKLVKPDGSLAVEGVLENSGDYLLSFDNILSGVYVFSIQVRERVFSEKVVIF